MTGEDSPGMAAYRVLLLGSPELSGPEEPIPLRQPKAAALLWYLAAQPGRSFTRAQLASVFWPQSEEASGRHALSSTLSRLRLALPIWPLRASDETLGWDPAAAVQVDAREFLDLTAQAARPECEREQAAALLSRAARLWRGAFLEGVQLADSESFEEWLVQERQLWEHRLLGAVDQLTECRRQAGAWDEMAVGARFALQVDPLQERFHRHLMLACYLRGDRAAALAQYNLCQQLLQEQLGCAPDPATRELRDAIASGRQPRHVGAAAQAMARTLARPTLQAVTSPPAPAAQSAVVGAPAAVPLIGREAELSTLHDALQRAANGRCRVMMVQGEAGQGKSRLVSELLRSLVGSGAPGTRLGGNCYEAYRGLPYTPFVEALAGLLPGLDLGRLGLADLWLAEVGRLLPDLAALRPDLPEPPTLDPGQQQHRLFEGVARFLAALPQPLLLVLEDVHWLDEASRLLWAYLSRHPQLRGCAIIATARAAEVAPPLAQLLHLWEREGRLTVLDLPPLSPRSTEALVLAFTGTAHRPFAQRLHQETGGNPLYATELLACLRGSRTTRSPELWLNRMTLPRNLQAAVRQRLERLDPGALDLLKAAAIFPAGASLAVLQQVADLHGEPALIALDQLLTAGLLRQPKAALRPGSPPQPLISVGFGQQVIRRVVMSDLSPARLQLLHRRAYQALQHETAGPEALAYHAYQGGMWTEGLRHSQEAAAAAGQVEDFPGAARLLEQALACLEQLPQTNERQGLAVDLRLELGRIGNYSEPGRITRWLAPAEAAAAAMGDQERLTEVLVQHSAALTLQGRLLRALPTLEKLLPIARAAGGKALLVSCLTFLGVLYSTRGDFARSLILLEESTTLQWEWDNLILHIAATGTLSAVHATLGGFARAEALAADLLRRVQAGSDLALTGHVYGLTAFVALQRGDWQQAVEASRRGLRLATGSKHRFHMYFASLWQGLALARLGDVAGGLAAQRECIDLAGRAGTRLLLDRAYGALAEIHLQAGDLEQAARNAQSCLKVAETNGYLYGTYLARRLQGQIATAEGRHGAALDLLRLALDGVSAARALPEVARCHAALSLLPGANPLHLQEAKRLLLHLGLNWDLEQLLRRTAPTALRAAGGEED